MSKLKIATLYRTIDSLVMKNAIVANKSDKAVIVGRPSDMLSINGSYAYIFSILVRRFTCTMALVDFANEIVGLESIDININTTPSQLLLACYKTYSNMIINLGIDEQKVIGVTISTFGTTDYSTSRKLQEKYPGFKWSETDAVSELKKIFKLPVWFENTARSAAQGNYINRYIKEHNNIAYVVVGEGIGLGIIIDGRIVRTGNRNIYGIGHMVVDSNGTKCRCGKYGCIETKVSPSALVSQVMSELDMGKQSILSKKQDSLSYHDVCRAAEKGDKLASYVIENAALNFAIGLENILNILNLDLIVIGGELPENSKLFCEVVKNKLDNITPGFSIAVETNQTETALRGSASAFVLQLLE
jgi:predicted NBD/HSP70 family sugar kinase